MKILRGILAIVIGCVAGGIVVAIVDSISHSLYPIPGLENATTPEEVRSAVSDALPTLPTAAFVIVQVGWLLSSWVAAWIAARIATGTKVLVGMTAGVFLAIATVANLLLLPHPGVMWIAVPLMLYSAWAGARWAARSATHSELGASHIPRGTTF